VRLLAGHDGAGDGSPDALDHVGEINRLVGDAGGAAVVVAQELPLRPAAVVADLGLMGGLAEAVRLRSYLIAIWRADFLSSIPPPSPLMMSSGWTARQIGLHLLSGSVCET
jgi:hypothetical protein